MHVDPLIRWYKVDWIKGIYFFPATKAALKSLAINLPEGTVIDWNSPPIKDACQDNISRRQVDLKSQSNMKTTNFQVDPVS